MKSPRARPARITQLPLGRKQQHEGASGASESANGFSSVLVIFTLGGGPAVDCLGVPRGVGVDLAPCMTFQIMNVRCDAAIRLKILNVQYFVFSNPVACLDEILEIQKEQS